MPKRRGPDPRRSCGRNWHARCMFPRSGPRPTTPNAISRASAPSASVPASAFRDLRPTGDRGPDSWDLPCLWCANCEVAHGDGRGQALDFVSEKWGFGGRSRSRSRSRSRFGRRLLTLDLVNVASLSGVRAEVEVLVPVQCSYGSRVEPQWDGWMGRMDHGCGSVLRENEGQTTGSYGGRRALGK
jgi:hypothetical protein